MIRNACVQYGQHQWKYKLRPPVSVVDICMRCMIQVKNTKKGWVYV